MADVIFLLIVVAFFGLMVLLVKFCDRVIGPDETRPAEVEPDTTDETVAS